MKKAFSLIEIIIVIIVISILIAFAVSKVNDSLDFTNEVKVKSQIALVRNSLSNKISSNLLLGKSKDILLDSESINKKGSRLFSNILDIPLISTSSSKKEIGKWIKKSSKTYIVYISKNEFLEFELKDNNFICKSDKDLCERYE